MEQKRDPRIEWDVLFLCYFKLSFFVHLSSPSCLCLYKWWMLSDWDTIFNGSKTLGREGRREGDRGERGKNRSSRQRKREVGRRCFFGSRSVCLTRLAFIEVGQYQRDPGCSLQMWEALERCNIAWKIKLKLCNPSDKLGTFLQVYQKHECHAT